MRRSVVVLSRFVQLSSERVRQAVAQDCSFAKKQASPPVLLVVVRSERMADAGAGACSSRNAAAAQALAGALLRLVQLSSEQPTERCGGDLPGTDTVVHWTSCADAAWLGGPVDSYSASAPAISAATAPAPAAIRV